MGYATNSIMARIEWCRRQSAQVRGHHECEEWHAEEQGLRDALLKQDHSSQYRSAHPELFARYAIGLQDGHALLRTGAVGPQVRLAKKAFQHSPHRNKSHDSPR